MPGEENIFSKYYDVQESWIGRQLNELKHESFINMYDAKKELEENELVTFINHLEVDRFRDKHLSETGKRKLSATLRTYKKREKQRLITKRLDLNISYTAYANLAYLVEQSGLTKTQFIEKLINEGRKKVE